MSGLKLGDSSLSMSKSEQKLDKIRQSKEKKPVQKRLYEKTKPSNKLHEEVKPSNKLILEKKQQINPDLLPNQNNIPTHLKGELGKRDWITPKTENLQNGKIHRPLIELNAFVPQGDGVSTLSGNGKSQVKSTVSQLNVTYNKGFTPLNHNISELGSSSLRMVKGSAATLGKIQSHSDGEEDSASQSFQLSQDLCKESAYHIHSSIRNSKLHKNQYSIEDYSAKQQIYNECRTNFMIKKEQLKQSSDYQESNPLSKWQQKNRIKKSYVQEYRKRSKGGKVYLKTGKDKDSYVARQAAAMAQRTREAMMTIFRSVATKPYVILFLLLIFLFMGVMSALVTTTTSIVQGVISSAFGTTASSYTASEADLLEVEQNYKDKEQSLQDTIDNIETTMSGYDEYIYNLSEIGHDPHDLAALLTALYHAYTPSQVASKLDELFARQYSLTTVPTSETRYDSAGNPYTYKILTVTLTNTDIDSFAREFLSDDQYEHYLILQKTEGNQSDLFGDYFGGSGASVGNLDFTIPDHYLADDDFAKVYAEAIKYLGFPYAWGGQSPSTSFDCSGFMYWIYNSTGVYTHSRYTAEGYYNICTRFDSSSRQAGDLIFFTGTSSHASISHVGMYIGEGMMIHCASGGVSFASVDTGYWANSSLYVCYGRLPI